MIKVPSVCLLENSNLKQSFPGQTWTPPNLNNNNNDNDSSSNNNSSTSNALICQVGMSGQQKSAEKLLLACFSAVKLFSLCPGGGGSCQGPQVAPSPLRGKSYRRGCSASNSPREGKKTPPGVGGFPLSAGNAGALWETAPDPRARRLPRPGVPRAAASPAPPRPAVPAAAPSQLSPLPRLWRKRPRSAEGHGGTGARPAPGTASSGKLLLATAAGPDIGLYLPARGSPRGPRGRCPGSGSEPAARDRSPYSESGGSGGSPSHPRTSLPLT